MAWTRTLCMALVGLVAASSAVSAQDAPGGGQAAGAAQPRPFPVIIDPEWERRPTNAEMTALFPPEAGRLGLGGEVTLGCTVSITGLLRDCRVQREDPLEMGFGAAALAMSASFKMRPQTRDGLPVDGARVDVPIIFGSGPGGGGGWPRRTLYTNVPWLEAPSYEQWVSAYPARARAAGVSGTVSIRCQIRDDGHLRSCDLQNELPWGQGFGRAALSLTRYFRGPTQSRIGSSKSALVDLNIAFPEALARGETPALSPAQILQGPTADVISESFPDAARAAGVTSGKATVTCNRDSQGRVVDCQVSEETPTGRGFADAALSLIPFLRLSQWSSDGRPTATRVNIPIIFEDRRSE